jgi:hypothetical protein
LYRPCRAPPGKEENTLGIANHAIPQSAALPNRQLVEQRLGLFQIARVKAFGKPAIDRSEKLAGLIPLALISPEAREAGGSAELEGSRRLLAGRLDGQIESRSSLGKLTYIASDFTTNEMIFGFPDQFIKRSIIVSESSSAALASVALPQRDVLAIKDHRAAAQRDLGKSVRQHVPTRQTFAG